jgi:hypothetical protein
LLYFGLPVTTGIVRDGLAEHWRKSYVGETGKSMKALELGISKGLLAKNRDYTYRSNQSMSDLGNLAADAQPAHTSPTYHRTWETGLGSEIRVAGFSPELIRREDLSAEVHGPLRRLYLRVIQNTCLRNGPRRVRRPRRAVRTGRGSP